MDVTIYALSDPMTGEIRYVGKTINLQKRLNSHRADRRGKSYKAKWLARILDSGNMPKVDVLETANHHEWEEAERFWIAYLRFIGCRLTNLETGGSGGKRHAPEVIEKMRHSHTGKVISQEQREKLRRANIGKKASPETRQKMRDARAGKPIPVEQRAKISRTLMGHPVAEETTRKRLQTRRWRDGLRWAGVKPTDTQSDLFANPKAMIVITGNYRK